MSVPKVKCPSCGTEWVGPVVFCGECGTPITTAPRATPEPGRPSSATPTPSSGQGDRVARMPPAPAPEPIAPIASAATPPVKKGAKPVVDPARPSRPSDLEARRTVMGMPAVAAPEPAKRRDTAPSGKRSRKGSVQIPNEPATLEDAEKMLEALDAGFENIAPTEVPVIPITPSVVPEVPARLSESSPVPAGSSEAFAPAPAPAPAPEIPQASPVAAATPSEMADLIAGLDDGPAITVAPAPDSAVIRAQHEADMSEVRSLFTEMAVAHARPLRDFMIEVSWGDPTREWIDVAVPASSALRRAAAALEMPDLGAALDGFAAALELCAGEASIGADAKELLLGAYGKLVELMPAAFALEGERGRREPIIVRSLLLQVSGVHKVALDKIYAAGLTSLDMLYAAGPRELAETTGLDLDLSARIHERFQQYRREVNQIDPGRDRAAERAELQALVGALARAHEAHEKLAAAWTGDAAAARVRARRERGDVLLKINVLLARMGEVNRQKALEKVPFAQKIRDLSAFLAEAEQRAASRP